MSPDDPRDPAAPPPSGEGPGAAPTGADGSGVARSSEVPTDLDELVSALLDGDVRGDAATAARRRPDVVARLASVVAARDALRRLPPPPAAGREAAIAAALAAYDTGDPSSEEQRGATGRRLPLTAPDHDPGRPGDEVGVRRAVRPPRRGVRWLGAAAAAAVVIAVVGLAVVGVDRHDDDTATSDAPTSQDDAGAALDAPESATEAAPDDGAAASRDDELAATSDLGAFASVDALLDAAAAVGRRTPAPAAGADTDASSPDAAAIAPLTDRCPGGVPGPIADAGPDARLVGTGTVDGATVEVWTGGAPGEPLVVALGPSCDVLSSRPRG